MKIVIIVQARMSSTRLPGKILKVVLQKTLLEFQVERLRRVELADEIVIATTTNNTDQPIIDLCGKLHVLYFRGSEEDVLSRYYGAAKLHNASVIVRVTSDCPIIDPHVIDKIIQFYLDYPDYDYVSNCLERTYPRGMDTEVFSFEALQETFFEATAPSDREHVTPFIHMNPQRFHLANVSYSEDQSCHRWTVDTPQDFELIKRIIETLYTYTPQFTLEDCLDLLSQHHDWSTINTNVEQKEYGE